MNSLSVQFTSFDLLLFITLVFSMSIGFVRGFVRESLGIAAWSFSGFMALQDFQWPHMLLQSWIANPTALRLASMTLVFILCLVMSLSLTQWISYRVHKGLAQSVDRSLGLAFGLARGCAFILMGYTASLFIILPQDQPALVRLSRSCVWLDQGVRLLPPLLPESIQNHGVFRQSLAQLYVPTHSAQDLALSLSSPPAQSQDPVDLPSAVTDTKASTPSKQPERIMPASQTDAAAPVVPTSKSSAPASTPPGTQQPAAPAPQSSKQTFPRTPAAPAHKHTTHPPAATSPSRQGHPSRQSAPKASKRLDLLLEQRDFIHSTPAP
jgi:membrane protein required for colicin V production